MTVTKLKEVLDFLIAEGHGEELVFFNSSGNLFGAEKSEKTEVFEVVGLKNAGAFLLPKFLIATKK